MIFKRMYTGALSAANISPKKCFPKAPLRPRVAGAPWSHVMIDFVGPLVKSSRGNEYCLVLVDLFSKYVEALPTRNAEAETVARMLVQHVFSRWGLPTKISSDQGTHFTGHVVRELCKVLEIKQNFHISWHPQSGGAVERVNKTIMEVLKKFVSGVGRDWDLALPLVLMALRSTPHGTTGVSPHEIMTGRKMILPHHLVFAYPEAAGGYDSEYTYVSELQENLRHTFSFVRENIGTSARVNKNFYDRKASHREYEVGDRVYYYKFSTSKKKRKKFLTYWAGPYKIVQKASSVAYQIAINSKKKWVHANQLRAYFGPSPQTSIEEKDCHAPSLSKLDTDDTDHDQGVLDPVREDPETDSEDYEPIVQEKTTQRQRESHIDSSNILDCRTRSGNRKI